MSHSFISSAAVAAMLFTTTHAFAAKSADDFIKDAIQGDNSEIMLGQLAEQKGGTDQAREFGRTLVTDHSKAKDEASAVAKQIGVTPPDQPTAEAQDEKTKLSNLSGSAFDKEFANYMVKDHEKDIQEFKEQVDAKQGPTSDLAAKQLPVLQKHLDMAKAAENAAPESAMAKPAESGNAATAAVANAPTQETPEEWRASKLAGVPIYGPDNKKVGSITDVLMSKEGRAESVVVGVGGFLGIGEKDVAIPFAEVKFTDQPVGGTAPNTNAATKANKSEAYPNHGMIDMTADQLKKAPSFRFAS
jgi:putative membrane protein